MAYDWLTALKGVSSVAGAVGAYKAGDAQAEAYKTNAKLARQQGVSTLQQGASEALMLNRQTRQQMGTQQAAIASNNLQTSGTALQVLTDTARMGAMDEATIRNNAARQAWGYEVQAVGDEYQASLAKSNARSEAIGSLATGLMDTASYYKKSKEADRTANKTNMSRIPSSRVSDYFKK